MYFNPPWPFGVGSLQRRLLTSARLLRAGTTHTNVRAESLTCAPNTFSPLKKKNADDQVEGAAKTPTSCPPSLSRSQVGLVPLKERANVGEVRDLSKQVCVMES